MFNILFCMMFSWAQNSTKISSQFISSEDQQLSIDQIVVGQFSDNMSSIYSKPLREEFIQRLNEDPQWKLQPPEKTLTLAEFKTDEIKKIAATLNNPAFLFLKFIKGPQGLTYQLQLHVGPQGLPLLQEEVTLTDTFDLESVKQRVFQSFDILRDKIPYRGKILSRKADQVTLNIGKNFGLRDHAEINAIQIITLQRHPKKQILVSTEREILARIKITKADDYLSFGEILYEKSLGVVQPGTKIIGDESIVYNRSATKDLGAAHLGENPKPWLPAQQPQFGKLQVVAGFGQYTQNATLRTAGSVSGSNSLAPTIGVLGEAWLNELWFGQASLRQSSFSINNSLSGSSPEKLNLSLLKTNIVFGRNFLMANDFWGPKIYAAVGFGKVAARVDQSSPLAFSNMDTGGLNFQFGFSTHLGEDAEGNVQPYDLGLRLNYFMSPGVSEGVSSGSLRSSSITDFAFQGGYRKQVNLRYFAELSMEYVNVDFSTPSDRTDPASNITHRFNVLLLGMEYGF